VGVGTKSFKTKIRSLSLREVCKKNCFYSQENKFSRRKES